MLALFLNGSLFKVH